MKKYIIFFIILIPMVNLLAQEGAYVRINKAEAIPTIVAKNSDNTMSVKFSTPDYTNLFSNYEISEFKKVFKSSKKAELQDLYLIETKDISLFEELDANYKSSYEVVEMWEKPQLLYEPNDYNLELDAQSDLDLIRAKDAWEITKGSSNIVIGISDTYIDEDHEDLVSEINSVLSNGNPNGSSAFHGVGVSFCAAGATDNSVGLSSIGFNCIFLRFRTLVPAESGQSVLSYPDTQSC